MLPVELRQKKPSPPEGPEWVGVQASQLQSQVLSRTLEWGVRINGRFYKAAR